MKLGNGRYILVTVLVLALLLNPVAGIAGAASALPSGDSATGGAASGNLFQQSAALLGSLFHGGELAAAGPLELEEGSLLEPLFGTVEGFLQLFLEDAELKEVLGEVLDEILADERIAGYDVEALVVGTLRDERLVDILGSVIARHLREEEFLHFVEQLTSDLGALLKDPAIISYLQQMTVSLLKDERINEFVFEIVYFITAHVDRFIAGIGDSGLIDALSGLAGELIELFKEPVLKYADEIMEDERVEGYIDRLNATLEGLDEDGFAAWFINRLKENLKEDDDFDRAFRELKVLLLGTEEPGPDGMLTRIAEQLTDYILNRGDLKDLVDPLLAELTGFGSLSAEGIYEGSYGELFAALSEVLDDLKGGLTGEGGALTAIGAEFESIMAHYVEDAPYAEPSDATGCMEDLQEAVADQKPVEDEVADFLNYWAEVAAWVAQKKIGGGDLEALLDRYLGEDADYLPGIIDAVMLSAGEAGDDLRVGIGALLEDPQGDIAAFKAELTAFLDTLLKGEDGLIEEIAPQMTAIIEDKLGEMIASGRITGLLEGKGGDLLETLMGLVTGLLEELTGMGLDQAGGDELLSLLNSIVLDLPFDALTDFIDEADVRELIGGLGELVDRLPLGDVAPFVRDNSEQLGHTIADILLNGMADGIEAKEPKDPRVAEVIKLLTSEERLRRFYVDLGGRNPDKVTAESGVVSIILAVLLEVAGDQDRIERFRGELAADSAPVKEDLLGYGKKLGDWLLGSLRSFAEPFVRRALASFLIFTPRGYGDQFKADPGDWISYDRFSGDAAVGRQLAGEMLTRSMASHFVDESMFNFLVRYRTVEDFATPERLGVIQHFMAEIMGAEELKALNAEISSDKLLGLIGKGLPRLQAEKLPELVKPDPLTRDLNSFLEGLLPEAPFRLSLATFSLTADQIMDQVTGFVDDTLPAVREKADELAGPLGNLPADLLGDAVIKRTRDEILAEVPEVALELVTGILEDQRLEQLLSSTAETVFRRVMADEGLVDKAFDLAGGLLAELQPDIEEALVTVLTGNNLPGLLGELAGDLLEDDLLLTFVEDLLDASRMIAVGGYHCPSGGTFYKPGQFLGSTGGIYPLHGFEGDPELPAPFPFVRKEVKVEIAELGLQTLVIEPYFFEMGCNNGLYMFTQELLNWMDPQRSQAAQYSNPTPGSFLRDYLPGTYLKASQVRAELARPVAALIVATATGTVGELAGERAWIRDFVLGGEGLPLNPLQVLAEYLRGDRQLPGMIGDLFKDLDEPYGAMVDLLHDNTDIEGLLREILANLPLEEGAGSILDSEALRGLLDEAGIELDLAPLRPLLRIDRQLPQVLLQRAQIFPASRVTNFLTVKQRLNRMTSMVEDMKARFIADLLTDPELIDLESELALEKVEAANYTLARGVFNIAEKFVNNGDLVDHLGRMAFDFIGEQYGRVKKFFRFILGLPGGGAGEASSPGLQPGAGPARCGGVLFKKEVA